MGKRYAFGPFRLDASRGLLTLEGEPVPLGSRAFAVLHALVRAGGEVVSKNELLSTAWHGTVVEEANLSVQIAALRKALGSMPEASQWIGTVARVGYRFLGPVRLEMDADSPASGDAGAGKSSIVVLPFINLTGKSDQQYFVDGVTEDIIDALSRFRWFFVIGRNASFALKGSGASDAALRLGVRYAVEGSVRSSDTRVRISVALSDAVTGGCLWTGRFDFEADEMLGVQDRIVEQVVGALEPELLKNEARRSSVPRRGVSADTWDLLRQGTHAFHQVTRATHLRARELFRTAGTMESELPDAQIWLARVNAGIVAYGWSDNPQQDLAEGRSAALEAIRRDERSPYAHYSLAIISVYAGELAQAIRAAERAIALNPSFALGYLVLGMGRLFADRPADAVEPLERGLNLNPHDPQNFVWYTLLAFARFFSGDAQRALQAAQEAWDLRPAWQLGAELIACCHAASGRVEEAERWMNQLTGPAAPVDKVLEPLRRCHSWRTHIDARLVEIRGSAAV